MSKDKWLKIGCTLVLILLCEVANVYNNQLLGPAITITIFSMLIIWLPDKDYSIKHMERTIFTHEMLDRHNFGLFIIKLTASENIKDNVRFAATVSFKLGYQSSKKIKRYGKTNFLTDGWFCDLADTPEELCDILNNDKDGYRLLTKEEVIYMIKHRQQGFL